MQQTIISTFSPPQLSLNSSFIGQSINKDKNQSNSYLTMIKKFIYFFHFILIAGYTTYILVKYPEVRQLSFTLFVLIIFGYMAIWTIIVNFIFLIIKKQHYAVVFDRLVIKFIIMLWPIFGIISYSRDGFLNIDEISYFALYLTIVSFLLILYEIYTCTICQNQNPQYVFQKNNLKQTDDLIWKQRKQYNENIIKNRLI